MKQELSYSLPHSRRSLQRPRQGNSEDCSFSTQLYKTNNMGKILYDFDSQTPTFEKLNVLESSFYKIPTVIIRDVAFLPDQRKNLTHESNEQKIIDLSERIRKSVSKIRRLNFVNPQLVDEKYIDNEDGVPSLHLQTEEKQKSFYSENHTPSETNKLSQNNYFSARKKRERRHAFKDMREINNYVHVMPLQSKDSIPYWIRDRQDFLKIYFGKQIKEHLEIPKICSKESSTRSFEETLQLINWLKSQTKFLSLKTEFYQYFAQRMTCQVFIEGEQIQKNDFMGILYEGIILKVENQKVKKFEIMDFLFRDKAEVEQKLIAETNVVLLTISYSDYEAALQDCLFVYQRDFTIMLGRSNFFHQTETESLAKLSQFGILHLYFRGEIIQNFKDLVENFSIIFSGKVRCEQLEETYVSNKWPKSQRSWEIKIIQRQSINKKILQEADFFGDEEILNDIQSKKKLVAEENSLILTIQKKMFFKIFDSDTIFSFKRFRNQEKIPKQHNDEKQNQTDCIEERRKRLESAMTLIFQEQSSSYKLDIKAKKFDRFKRPTRKSAQK